LQIFQWQEKRRKEEERREKEKIAPLLQQQSHRCRQDAAAGIAQPGEKLNDAAIEEIAVIATINAIDQTSSLDTLTGTEITVKTVKAGIPENLQTLRVGDEVKNSPTEAIGISVTK